MNFALSCAVKGGSAEPDPGGGDFSERPVTSPLIGAFNPSMEGGAPAGRIYSE
jgi:hypothetical protein